MDRSVGSPLWPVVRAGAAGGSRPSPASARPARWGGLSAGDHAHLQRVRLLFTGVILLRRQLRAGRRPSRVFIGPGEGLRATSLGRGEARGNVGPGEWPLPGGIARGKAIPRRHLAGGRPSLSSIRPGGGHRAEALAEGRPSRQYWPRGVLRAAALARGKAFMRQLWVRGEAFMRQLWAVKRPSRVSIGPG